MCELKRVNVLAGCTASAEAKTSIMCLTTNYQTNPIGIEAVGIRFGWQMDSNVIGSGQSSYQIKVFSEEGAEVWDSGRINSNKSTGIAFGGTVSEREIYRWKVTVWDHAGHEHTAEAFFETGVSNLQEWKAAEFICMNKSRLAPVFRVEKPMEQKKIRKVRLYITALGAYEAYVNGNRAGEWDKSGKLVYHHMDSGYGNRNVSLGYQTYDVTSFVKNAKSVAVAVLAGTGWYNGMGNTEANSPAVKALLMIDYEDGSTSSIGTNKIDWKGTLAGGITASGIYYGEDYNAIFAKELGDYTKAGYDDRKWVNAFGSGEAEAEYYGTDFGRNVTAEDKGMVRRKSDLKNMRLSTKEFNGVIRAQTGLSGRMTGEFDQNPVSAVVYSGTKVQSKYKGGEIDTIAEYTGADMFEKGIILKKGQTMVVNMGQNLTAVPNVRFLAPRGTRAVMRFAEMPNDGSEVGFGATQADGPKGAIYQKSIRNARSLVTYVFSGDGTEEYQPAMSFFGYQYVELTADGDMTIYGLTSKCISSVSEQTGYITTNNEDVNRFFKNVLFGQLSNYYTAPTDCNQRDERLSWTGDTQAFARTAVYNFNSYAFLSDMQKIFDENTEKNGYVGSVADCVDKDEFFGNWAAGWSDVLIIVPWVLYQQTGDVSFLKDNWKYFDIYMNFIAGKERGANQSWIPNNSRNYGDWLSFQGTSIEVMYDYYYGYMNQLMAEISGILGKKEEQAAYREKFENIKKTFLKTHVTFEDGNLVIKSGEGNKNFQFMYSAGKGGVWEDNSQTSLLWMLKLGFYDSENMRDMAHKLLIENIKNENPDSSGIRAKSGKNTLAVGFLGSNVIAPVLTDIGNPEVSYDLLLQDGQPSWLFEVKAGATTVWERWNSYSPGIGFGDSEMNSFNHYAYGSVVEWMYCYMAGISSDLREAGFKHIILQPTLDCGTKYNQEERINRVAASYNSVYGKIESSWKSENGKLVSYHARIPANTMATLYLPIDMDNVQDGQLSNISGVAFVGMTEHNGQVTAEFTLESGSYDFAVVA